MAALLVCPKMEFGVPEPLAACLGHYFGAPLAYRRTTIDPADN